MAIGIGDPARLPGGAAPGCIHLRSHAEQRGAYCADFGLTRAPANALLHKQQRTVYIRTASYAERQHSGFCVSYGVLRRRAFVNFSSVTTQTCLYLAAAVSLSLAGSN